MSDQKWIRMFHDFRVEIDRKIRMQDEFLQRKKGIESAFTKELFDNIEFINSYKCGYSIKLTKSVNGKTEITSNDLVDDEHFIFISLQLVDEDKKIFECFGNVGKEKIPNNPETIDTLTENILRVLAYRMPPWEYVVDPDSYYSKSVDKFD